MDAETMSDVMPTLSVVRGNPTDEEMAALTAVLIGLAAAQQKRAIAPELRYGGGWKSYWHIVRHPLNPSREPWRSSFRG